MRLVDLRAARQRVGPEPRDVATSAGLALTAAVRAESQRGAQLQIHRRHRRRARCSGNRAGGGGEDPYRSSPSACHLCLNLKAVHRHVTACIGSLRRPIQRDSETGAIPSRAAALLRLRDSRIATSRSVAFSMSGKVDPEWSGPTRDRSPRRRTSTAGRRKRRSTRPGGAWSREGGGERPGHPRRAMRTSAADPALRVLDNDTANAGATMSEPTGSAHLLGNG